MSDYKIEKAISQLIDQYPDLSITEDRLFNHLIFKLGPYTHALNKMDLSWNPNVQFQILLEFIQEANYKKNPYASLWSKPVL